MLKPVVHSFEALRIHHPNRPSSSVYLSYQTTRRCSTRPAPNGLPIRLPHGRFFSAAMIAPNASIQPMLPDPTANITSISDQQQPRQSRPPWCNPRLNARRASPLTRPMASDECKGRTALIQAVVFQRSELVHARQDQDDRPDSLAVSIQQSSLKQHLMKDQVRHMHHGPEPYPDRQISQHEQRDQAKAMAPSRDHPVEQGNQRQAGWQHHGEYHQSPTRKRRTEGARRLPLVSSPRASCSRKRL